MRVSYHFQKKGKENSIFGGISQNKENQDNLTMASNTGILKFYDLDNLDKYCCSLEKFGQIENLAGDFIFLVCKGPLLTHQKCRVKR